MKTLKKILFLMLFVPATLIASENNEFPEGTPTCVKEKIKKLMEEDCPSVQSVHQYIFQGHIVYVFNPKECGADLTTEILVDNCENMCLLGGQIGATACNGVEFYKYATNKKLIWEDK